MFVSFFFFLGISIHVKYMVHFSYLRINFHLSSTLFLFLLIYGSLFICQLHGFFFFKFTDQFSSVNYMVYFSSNLRITFICQVFLFLFISYLCITFHLVYRIQVNTVPKSHHVICFFKVSMCKISYTITS